MKTIATTACFLLYLCAVASSAQEGKNTRTPVPLLVAWGGAVDGNLANKMPGHVLDEASWNKLWQSWRPREPVPYVNFEATLVLVVSSGDLNAVAAMPTLDAKGDLRISLAITLLETPRDSKTVLYQFAVISRQGIKTINGTPLGKK